MKIIKQAKTIISLSIFSIAAIAQTANAQNIEQSIRPMTNVAMFDLPYTQTYIHPVFLHQKLPSQVNTILGKLPVGGDLNIYALALEYAFNDNFSFVASKDGYIDFNPDSTFKSESGFADVTGGIKWAFYQNDKRDFAAAAKVLIDLPLGNDDVFQGNGDGSIFPSVNFTKIMGRTQFSGIGGLSIPFDSDEESTMLFNSWHISYELTKVIHPLLELNHYRVLSEGDGNSNFNAQAGGAVPAVARFEGGDLINLGASNSKDNKDFVSIAVGSRFRLADTVDLGICYELPLTDEEDSLMESRTTIDLVVRF
jgi:hypothetical protein